MNNNLNLKNGDKLNSQEKMIKNLNFKKVEKLKSQEKINNN